MTGQIPSSANHKYFQLRCKHLSGAEKTVILLIDEVYTAEKLELDARGELVGLAENSDTAKTVLVFIVKSLRSPFSEVVSLVPMRNLTADVLMEIFKSVMNFLSSYLHVQAVSVDNHIINRRLYSSLYECQGVKEGPMESPSVIHHPQRSNDFLFLLYDVTHIIKNFFNNFHVRKHFVFQNFEKNEIQNANFKDLEKIVSTESSQSLRAAHRISAAILNPTSISKISAKHALGEIYFAVDYLRKLEDIVVFSLLKFNFCVLF